MKVELIVSDEIKEGRCPMCGGDMRDKGSHMRCEVCPFKVAVGTWDASAGFCLMYEDCDPWDAHMALERALEAAADRKMDWDYCRRG